MFCVETGKEVGAGHAYSDCFRLKIKYIVWNHTAEVIAISQCRCTRPVSHQVGSAHDLFPRRGINEPCHGRFSFVTHMKYSQMTDNHCLSVCPNLASFFVHRGKFELRKRNLPYSQIENARFRYFEAKNSRNSFRHDWSIWVLKNFDCVCWQLFSQIKSDKFIFTQAQCTFSILQLKRKLTKEGRNRISSK